MKTLSVIIFIINTVLMIHVLQHHEYKSAWFSGVCFLGLVVFWVFSYLERRKG